MTRVVRNKAFPSLARSAEHSRLGPECDDVLCQVEFWETYIGTRSLRIKQYAPGTMKVSALPTLAARLENEEFEEKWAQQYLKENYAKFGFEKIEGPFSKGPDFRVMVKRRWHWAEVEVRWQNYLKHKHHLSRDFENVEFLILLSSVLPTGAQRDSLPRQVRHIDHTHFAPWFEVAFIPEKNKLRVTAVSGMMQKHWLSICPDVERDMATCPECSDCAYFGEGITNESGPFFEGLANDFLTANACARSGEFDLRKINPGTLLNFVEEHPPE